MSQFRYCGSHAYVLRSFDDPPAYRIAGSCCKDRFCLPCANERSRSVALNVLDVAESKSIRFLTLTLRSTHEPLADLLHKLYTSFQSLRRRKLWTSRVTGGVAFLEVVWKPDKQRWHPHFHILVEGRYLPQQALRNLWYSLTGDSHIVDIRQVRDNAMASKYVSKYASKPFNNTFLNRTERLDEAILALKHRKLIVTFGTWRGVTLSPRPSDEAWQNLGSLESFITSAASGHHESQTILASLTDIDLTPLLADAYKRGPPPDVPKPKPSQLTWLGVWQRDGYFDPRF